MLAVPGVGWALLTPKMGQIWHAANPDPRPADVTFPGQKANNMAG
jgi:hypothetical protein